MKALASRKNHRRRAKSRCILRAARLQEEESRQRQARLEILLRLENAAKSIQCVRRVFMARAVVKRMLLEFRMSILIQKRCRIKLARKRRDEMLIERRRVVPKGFALKLLLKRSETVRELDSWKEMRDKSTNTVFYFNSHNLETQWEIPPHFEGSFCCNWGECLESFQHLEELETHRDSHKWMCPSCWWKNPCDLFPICYNCSNNVDIDGFRMGEIVPAGLTTAELVAHLKARKEDIMASRSELVSRLERIVNLEKRHKVTDLGPKMFSTRLSLEPVPCPSFPEFSGKLAREEKRFIQKNDMQDMDVEELLKLAVSDKPKFDSPLQSSKVWKKKRSKQYALPPNIKVDEVYLDMIKNGIGKREEEGGLIYKGELRDGCYDGLGTMSYPDGSVYIGMWKENQRQGKGVLIKSDGSKYLGEWQDNFKRGLGTFISAHQDVLQGTFLNGYLEGDGEYTSCNGDCYIGGFLKGKYSGTGKFTKVCGDVFYGRCFEGKANGAGILRMANGASYRGEWKNDLQHGYGKAEYEDGSTYTGNWMNGLFEGKGKFENRYNGELYNGMWHQGKITGIGIYLFSYGDVYEGSFVDGNANGHGVYLYRKSGNVYVGKWLANRKHGLGILYLKSGATYEGMWREGKVHGLGVFTYNNGDVYSGQWKEGMKSGRGKFSWINGNRFDGEFKNNFISGSGQMIYSFGHIYTGDWKDNKKHGIGTLKSGNGTIYQGRFERDEKHGKGKITFRPNTALEETYEGDFWHDKCHGTGKYCYMDGSTTYDGEWVDDAIEGRGILRSSELTYTGEFTNGLFCGQGQAVYSNGQMYWGQWVDGLQHGEGSLLKSDGQRFSGYFLRGKKHGEGRIKFPDGNTFNGTWCEGKKVGHGIYTRNDLKLKVFSS